MSMRTANAVTVVPPSMMAHSQRHWWWRLREWVRGGIRGVLTLQVASSSVGGLALYECRVCGWRHWHAHPDDGDQS